MHGPFFESVEIDDNGTESSVRVGDRYNMQLKTFTDPVSGDPHEVHMVLPQGFIFKDGLICTSAANSVNADGVSYDHPGKNAYYSEVEWSSENRMAPSIG